MHIKAPESQNLTAILIGLLLASVLFLTACGGGGDGGEGRSEPQAENKGPGPLDEGGFFCELAAVLLGGECVGIGNMATCSDDPFNNPLGLPSGTVSRRSRRASPSFCCGSGTSPAFSRSMPTSTSLIHRRKERRALVIFPMPPAIDRFKNEESWIVGYLVN